MEIGHFSEDSHQQVTVCSMDNSENLQLHMTAENLQLQMTAEKK